ncbi:MAG: 16S rRNA (cytidine(1402)-2'-O)-methyltransferase [Acidimicrobiales bacterium]|nr:16S rRNA (cytidine(1402)-2'-O)-methyltransferase [Acidimicrobiales bacterium]RZV47973.1 MAG: 16S rRNA (cytidine(1402)-2'-O)-methyltransferase [Acidimicrobiales bacterium]
MTSDHGPALVLVGTPIGNLGDMSARAMDELRDANVIACEDTRRTGALLKQFAISHSPFIVCNEHTEFDVAAEIVDRIRAGERVALATDAGMPSISDPGQRVVAAVVEAGLLVTCAPGPSAVSMALAVSGLDTDRFCFEGFLPRKGRERGDRLAALRTELRTSVFFESPHRVLATVSAMAEEVGEDRAVVLARELTKMHEQVWRGTLGEAISHCEETTPRGEYVIVLAGATPVELTDEHITDALRAELAAGSSRRDAVDAVVAGLGAAKRRVYDLALDLPS